MSEFSIEDLPDYLKAVLAGAPANVNRRIGAGLVTQHLFPVSHRTLESWPLPIRHINGQAVMPTVALFVVAYAKLSAAPLIMGGRRRGEQSSACPTGRS